MAKSERKVSGAAAAKTEPVAPRRRAKREASQALVDAILDAASMQLSQAGLEGMTTNLIAERAGVSVGSLYQYFPNKQAIAAALTRRLNERLITQLTEVVARPVGPVERLDGAIEVLCSPQTAEFALRRSVLLDVPRRWESAGIRATEERVMEVMLPLATDLAPDIAFPTIRARLLLALYAVRGAVQSPSRLLKRKERSSASCLREAYGFGRLASSDPGQEIMSRTFSNLPSIGWRV